MWTGGLPLSGPGGIFAKPQTHSLKILAIRLFSLNGSALWRNGAVPSWMCLVAGAWDLGLQPWLERRCVEWGLVVASIPPTKRIRDRACRR